MKDSKEYFDKVATEWDDMRTDFFSENIRITAYKKANIEKGKVAADIGAGTGFISEGLIKEEIKVIAIDQSEEMLNMIKEKFSSYKDLKCLQGDAAKLPLQHEQVDYVFANMFLHHVENPEKAIKEMVRILKKGGKLVITDLDKHDFEFLKTEQYDRWMGFHREDISRWFQEVKLENVSLECVGSDCCADSKTGCGQAKISVFIAYGEKNK